MPGAATRPQRAEMKPVSPPSVLTSPVNLVGLSGPSCSGKSTIATRLAASLGGAPVLQQDVFFIDPDLCSPFANFCDLSFLDVSAFVDALELLAAGRAATVPEIDWRTFRRVGTRSLAPTSHLVIEGMTIFRVPEVVRLCDHRVYLAPPWQSIERRKRERDASEREKSAGVIDHQVAWMRSEYENDLRRLGASVEIVDPTSIDVVDLLVARLRGDGGARS